MKKRGTPNRKANTQPPRGNWSNAYARARMKAGLTQEEASPKLHIDTKIISGIENDKHNPTPDIAVAMARLYGDDRLPKKICREVCAIGRARRMPFDFNLEVVVPLMVERYDEIKSLLKEIPYLLKNKEAIQEISPTQWERLMGFMVRKVRDFARDMEILEISLDRVLEQAEKKTAFAAKR